MLMIAKTVPRAGEISNADTRRAQREWVKLEKFLAKCYTLDYSQTAGLVKSSHVQDKDWLVVKLCTHFKLTPISCGPCNGCRYWLVDFSIVNLLPRAHDNSCEKKK